jgi:hypothetical protein
VGQLQFGGELVEVDDQGVSRFSSFDVEGARLRVAARGYSLALAVVAARVNGGGEQGVAWRKMQDGFDGAEGAVIASRVEGVAGHK